MTTVSLLPTLRRLTMTALAACLLAAAPVSATHTFYGTPTHCGSSEPDFDADGTCDRLDQDDDNDGAPDSCDPDPKSPNVVSSLLDWLSCLLLVPAPPGTGSAFVPVPAVPGVAAAVLGDRHPGPF